MRKLFLVDTNVILALRKVRSGKADARVAKWADAVDAAALYLSVVVLHELELGVLLLERRDPVQGRLLRTWLNTKVVPAFEGRVLSVDDKVVLRSARLHVPDPRPLRDGLIAATALVHGMTVVTRNVMDFKPIGVSTLNPWNKIR